MEPRRLIQFFLVTAAILLIYQQAVRVFPQLGPPPAVNIAQDDAAVPQAAADQIAAGGVPADVETGQPSIIAPAPEPDNADAAAAAAELPNFPERDVTLGSLDPESGYFLKVTLSSQGAGIRRVELNDPKFRDLNDRDKPLAVVGGNEEVPLRSFANFSPAAKAALAPIERTLATVDWELIEESPERAVFRLPAMDGVPELTKTYAIRKGGDREEDAAGYMVDVALTARNESGEAVTFDYLWQGPLSVPLENLESTRTFVELKGGVLEPGETEPDVVSMLARDIVEEYDAAGNDVEQVTHWRSDLAFVGIDAQYFAALATATEPGERIDWVEEVVPDYVSRGETVDHSDITLQMWAQPMQLAAGGEAEHAMKVYFGPKRSGLLDEFGAGDVIAFGWFGAVSRVMLAVLGFFHHTLSLPYAIAIMLLTCCVRGLMTPISLKQAQQGKKMKEMAPKIKVLQEKYGDDKEGLMKAQMQLYRDEDFNMLAGCLPVFLQLPIFIGLYQALYNAIDLRLAEFLWIDNLAAPDHLFRMPFRLPFLGEWFNLLPILTCVLFIVQQKMFMPPAQSEEQAMQQKLMKYMMIGMGFIFYHVPAGLCLYFIASSLWGMTERTLIDRDIIKLPQKKKKAKKPRETPGWMQKLIDAADEAKKQQTS